MKLLAILLFILIAEPAFSATIEEAGLSDVQCRIRRIDNGAGLIQDNIACRFNTVSADGTVVRQGASTGLGNLSEAEGAAVKSCVEMAWQAIYSGEGFPVPTPRPPAQTPSPEDIEAMTASLSTPTPQEAP
jgi:hypothetical protein